VIVKDDDDDDDNEDDDADDGDGEARISQHRTIVITS